MNSEPRVTVDSAHPGMPLRRAQQRRGSAFPIAFGLTMLSTGVAVYDLLLFAAGLR